MTPEDAEFYATPAWCVRRLLDAAWPGGRWWLDPCAGDGAIPEALADGAVEWTLIDIRDTGIEGLEVCDYLRKAPPRSPWDACIMNPPFSKALAFAQKAAREADRVCMLQRLCWLASADRAEWLRRHTPAVYVLPNRPSFTGDGKTDGQDYAWFLWGCGDPIVRILADTSAAERKADAVPRRNRSQVEMFP